MWLSVSITPIFTRNSSLKGTKGTFHVATNSVAHPSRPFDSNEQTSHRSYTNARIIVSQAFLEGREKLETSPRVSAKESRIPFIRLACIASQIRTRDGFIEPGIYSGSRNLGDEIVQVSARSENFVARPENYPSTVPKPRTRVYERARKTSPGCPSMETTACVISSSNFALNPRHVLNKPIVHELPPLRSIMYQVHPYHF